MTGFKSAPGSYQARLSVGEFTQTQSVALHMDPRLTGDVSQNARQYEDLKRLTKMLFGTVEETSADLKSLKTIKHNLLH